ncbi:MAG TPA: hypothetical protein VGP76_19520, partial [Planctomycetaceae bacterium]|nr:hypothetical protein [Planctomycetaceae bacterium]
NKLENSWGYLKSSAGATAETLRLSRALNACYQRMPSHRNGRGIRFRKSTAEQAQPWHPALAHAS